MHEIFSNFYDLIMNTVANLGIYGPIIGSILIVLESIIPVLPLFVFITINTIAFGKILGFLISWICTIIGCSLSYFLVKKVGYNFIYAKARKKSLLKKIMGFFHNLSLCQITVILAIPFTPAFMMNIAAGLTNIPYKKYFIALVISKIFLVYFWGTIGVGLIESFKHPMNLLVVLIMAISAYILSLIIKKVFKIEW